MDNLGWSMERQMLLKTISGLQAELEEAQQAAGDGSRSAKEAADLARKTALAEAALARVGRLQAERDAAEEEAQALRQKLEEVQATAEAARAAAPAAPRSAAPAAAAAIGGEQEDRVALASPLVSVSSAASDSELVAYLRQQLEEAREALRVLAAEAEAEAEANEEQCSLLRAQVLELRQELARRAVDAADPSVWGKAEGSAGATGAADGGAGAAGGVQAAQDAAAAALDAHHGALAEHGEALAAKDAVIHELRKQLMEEQVQLQEARVGTSIGWQGLEGTGRAQMFSGHRHIR